MLKKILVTGGCGYIGSHTIIDLLDNGFDVISIDNLSNSTPETIDRIKQITGKHITNYVVDLCNYDAILKVLENHPGISGIIHFAAYKSVGESVEKPLLYFHNNMNSLLNILRYMQEFDINNLVFSSSCTVYGNATKLPVTENSPIVEPESPYGRTKIIGENIIFDSCKKSNSVVLRYFNPVGAHESGLIGELPLGKPNNLVPIITQVAIGKLSQMEVFGNDYDTRDGTCIRDYIHVMDIAHAHTLAMKYMMEEKNKNNYDVFNLGTGNGVTVLEIIEAFEKSAEVKLNYKIVGRRPGDVEAIYANNEKAKKELHWEIKRDIIDMMTSAWKWEQHLKSL